MKKLIYLTIIIAIAAYFYFGENPFNIYPASITEYVYTTEVPTSNKTITIGSFNIQTFGQTKSSKEEVMFVLSDIACKFDILAVQEIKDKSGKTPIHFMEHINQICDREYLLSERLGRTSSKESYMIIYNTEKVTFVEDSDFVVDDEEDIFEREPYVVKFMTERLDFFLVNIHIKPDDAVNEIKELSSISKELKLTDSEIIILGDLNADCSYFDEESKKQYFGDGFIWKITDEIDTTTKETDCTYDRIIVSDEMMKYYKKERGVLNFNKIYNLDYTETIEVSDHYPVWTNFRLK